jgi:Spy/CpxP family protein refolding chaperone
MRRFFHRGVIFLSICLFAGTAAVAQNRLGYNPEVYWYPVAGVLGLVQARDELKLTADQMEKIKEIGDEFVEKFRRPLYEASLNLPFEEQQKKLAELRKPEEEMVKKAKAILTAEQAARFRQIEIWVKGPLAFADPDLARELDLTDVQKGTLKTIGDEFENEVNDLMKRLRRDFRVRPTKEEQAKRREEFVETNKRSEELRAAKEAECLAVLTDDQKARFEKLRGTKFELRLPGRRVNERDSP